MNKSSMRRAYYSPIKRQAESHRETMRGRALGDEPAVELIESSLKNQRRQQPEYSRNHEFNVYHRHQHQQQQQQQPQQQQLASQEQEKPEEVYLCDCCGLTSELAPGMRFMRVFKSIFCLFNCLVFALAVANLGMGLWFRIDPKVYEIHKYIETQNFTIAGWLMLGCGLAAILVAAAGFAGSHRQSAGLLAFYFFATVALALASVSTLVLLTVYGLGQQLEEFMTKEVYEQIRRRTMDSQTGSLLATSSAAQFLDFLQIKLRCCGAADFRDYSKLGMVVPTSCYAAPTNFVSSPGCAKALRELFDLRAGLAAGFVSGSVMCQLFTTTLAALMFCSIYHWRAQARASDVVPARATSPTLPMLDREEPAMVGRLEDVYLYNQRARTRTPIVM